MPRVPEVINDFNVYSQGNVLIGIGEEMTLPVLQGRTATVEGAGVLGTYETGVAGHYDNFQVEIPFRLLSKDAFKIFNTNKAQEITLRGSQQYLDKASGDYVATGMRIVFRGRPIANNPGSVKAGNVMNATVTLNVMYYLIEIDGEKMLELDKANGVYKVNGEDLLAQIRSQC